MTSPQNRINPNNLSGGNVVSRSPQIVKKASKPAVFDDYYGT